eukprot:ctg_407.g189
MPRKSKVSFGRFVRKAGRLKKLVSFTAKLATEAPVNGGRNYNGPKVAKFLVLEIEFEFFLRRISGRQRDRFCGSGGVATFSGGQFDWGGRLLKGNGGAQRFPQTGQKSVVECKGIRKLNCKTYKSSRDESRP